MAYQPIDRERIGKTLKTLREEAGMTMEELGTLIGITPSAIAMYESGDRVPRDEIKIRIANIFSRSVEGIFFPNEQHET